MGKRQKISFESLGIKFEPIDPKVIAESSERIRKAMLPVIRKVTGRLIK